MPDFALPPDYAERVYAGWIGKCAGVRLGAPVENWTYQDIRDHLGEIKGYLPLPPGKIFKPDDDTAAPMIYIRALEDYGAQVSAAQIGLTLLNYLGDQHGTIWWGGYAQSAEHTGYLNQASGIPAPVSGSLALNGPKMAEAIGGQIFSDIWGLVAPNNPALAAEYAGWASSVTHDRNGIYGGQFIAALVSQAFVEKDILRLLEVGLSVIPAGCEYTRMVKAVRAFYLEHPQDWHACYRYIFENFGGDRYPGIVHIIPNAALVILALLYSQGDFSRAIEIGTEAGWDTDCNAGNVGAIMGVLVGLEGIPEGWRVPMNDVLVNASNIGARNLTDIPACADLLVRMGHRAAGLAEPARKARYHFDYPGATQGFLAEASRGSVIDIRNLPAPAGAGRALRFTVKKIEKKGALRLFVKTYYAPGDLSANFYGASFSPKVYPGQTLSARLYLPEGSPEGLRAALYAAGSGGADSCQGLGELLRPGEWQDLAFTLPPGASQYIAEVGVVIRHELDNGWNGSIYLDDLDWQGQPDWRWDFKQARNEFGAISGWTYLRGHWRVEDGACHGSGYAVSEAYSGDIQWQDYTVSASLTPLLGETHLVAGRVGGALGCYAFGLAPNGQVGLYKNDNGYRLVACAPFAWEMGRSYTVSLACRGASLVGTVADGPALEWTDPDRPFLSGQIGLVNFSGCHTRCGEVRVC